MYGSGKKGESSSVEAAIRRAHRQVKLNSFGCSQPQKEEGRRGRGEGGGGERR